MNLSRTGRASVAAATGVTLFALVACSSSANSGSSSNAKVVSGASVTIALSADPGSLDPQRSVNGPNLLMSVFGYDTTVSLKNDGTLSPEVLTSWKAKGNSYTLTVKSGITCSDGEALNAQTVADNINYVGNAKNASSMAGVAVPSGATAAASGSTVTVTLPATSPFFMQNLAELPLVCEKGIADRSPLAKTTIGSGPYVLSGVAPGVDYVYTLRKGYTWGPDGASTATAGMPAKVTFKVLTSQTTTANLLLNGQVNIGQVALSDNARLKAGGLFSSGSSLINNELAFNESPGQAGSDVAVRRALIADLNLSDLAKVDTGGLGQTADGLIADPKICSGNTMSGFTPSHDVAAAKAALQADGWVAGSGGTRTKGGKPLSISLIFSNGTPTTAATAQYIAAQWKPLGVDVTLNEQSFDQDSAVVFGKGEWGATLIGLGVSNPQTLVGFFSGPSPTEGNNFGHFNNAAYTAAVAKATTEDGTSGCADWNAGESALFKDADITPISTTPFVYWGKKATFNVIAHVLIPTSLRATK